MSTQAGEVQKILARIETLERHYRRLRRMAAGAALLVATAVVMGASGSSRTIEAQRFVLTDSTGRTRAALGLDKDTSAPALTFYTENGKLGVRLIVYGAENPFPILEMLDDNGKNTVALDNGGLHLNDPNSSSSVSLTVYGHPALTMLEGLPVVSLGIGSGAGTEPRLIIWDKDGFASTLGVTTLTDVASGTKRLTSAASLVMENKAGTVVWSAETVQQQIDALGAYVASVRTSYKSPDDVQRELDEFKDAACPVLRSLRASEIKLDYACGLH